MSAASPAQPQVRRNAAAAPSRSPQHAPQQPHAPVRQAAPSVDFSRPRGDEEVHVNLADIPIMRTTLEVDVFAPTLLSRLLDLIMPLPKR